MARCHRGDHIHELRPHNFWRDNGSPEPLAQRAIAKHDNIFYERQK
jgi:hypothetical protein